MWQKRYLNCKVREYKDVEMKSYWISLFFDKVDNVLLLNIYIPLTFYAFKKN